MSITKDTTLLINITEKRHAESTNKRHPYIQIYKNHVYQNYDTVLAINKFLLNVNNNNNNM